MATTTEPTDEIEVTEPAAPADEPDAPGEEARERSDDGGAGEGADDEVHGPTIRTAIALAFPVIACAVMVGGVFSGVSPRFYAAAAGILGIGLGYVVSSLHRRPFLSYAVLVIGMFGIGLVMLLPDVGSMLSVTKRIDEATAASSVLTPPVPFDQGWKPVLGWVMGLVGFGSAWLAMAVGWRSFALLVPLPMAAIAGISVPESAQVASGLAVLVLFAIGLGLISSEQAGGDDEESRPSVAYEVRKALKALPLIGAITVALFFLAQTDFLFPDPVYDPAQEPQKPKTQPLSEANDRVLFEVVDTDLTGPFRMGSLDVYDGEDWRLPPFAASELIEVPRDGIVDEDFRARQQLQATFIVRGLGGAVLPDLPNTVGIAASGPKLAYDARNGNIRLINGKAEGGFTYTVTAAGLPKVSDLTAIDFDRVSEDEREYMKDFTEIPDPPPAVAGLIGQAPTSSKWEQFDFLRKYILENVVASGTGTPISITPERVADMITGSKEGSPFEIVAAQAMLARWVGVPSRLGYGFDGGERVGEALQVRPRHGAAFVEVYFPGHKWLPVIGTPVRAEPTVGSDPSEQRLDQTIKPSNELGTRIYLPVIIAPGSVLARQIAMIVLGLMPFALLAFLAYTFYPALRKARRRSRRRAEALASGTRARVALSYVEWRDYATDLGFLYPTDTPLMFLERFIDDDEHTELAWLTTRVLWGDLRGDPDPQLATVAEELSRSLRRRLASVQPGSLRAVGVVSRLSLRNPYAPEPPRAPSRRRRSRAAAEEKEENRASVPA